LFIVSNLLAQSGTDAAGIYKKNCAMCHKPDGTGGPMKTPDFTSKEWQSKHKDQELITIITNGEKMMPPYGTKLKPAEIKAVVTDVIRKFAK
jgi:mono/diheme cytochrome c family protein